MFFLNRPSHTLAYSSLFKSRCLLRRIVQYFLLHWYVFDVSCNPACSEGSPPSIVCTAPPLCTCRDGSGRQAGCCNSCCDDDKDDEFADIAASGGVVVQQPMAQTAMSDQPQLAENRPGAVS